MSRCAGAGREQSEAASPSWPVEMFHTMDVCSVGWGAGVLSSLGVQSISFCEFGKFCKIQEFRDCGSGTSCKLVIGW